MTVRRHFRVLAIAGAITLSLGLSACNSSKNDTQAGGPVTIRIAMGSSGADVDKTFTTLKTQYEAKYPGRKVEVIIQEDDTYETIGLSNLLSSRNAPDAYFEWSGTRMYTKVDEGYAADVAEVLNGPQFAGRFNPGAFKGMTRDGKTYMVPWTGDVTDVVWYNKKVFADNAITVPTTWDEFMAVNQKLKDAGITPIVEGNKDKWPVGNWGSQLVSRVIGEQQYEDMMLRKAPMNSPGVVQALTHLKGLADNGYINASVNALPDDQAMSQFLLGKAAMTAIGSWLVADQVSQAKDLQVGYFNTPSVPGSGDQQSVLGVSTGFMVNAKSAHIPETVDFLALMSASDNTKLFVKAGVAPLTVDPFAGVAADPNTVSLAKLLESSPVVVKPADNIDVKVAGEFYDAVAAVIGGLKSPQEALDRAQTRVDALPKA